MIQVDGGCRGGCRREEREALVAMWFTALQVTINSVKAKKLKKKEKLGKCNLNPSSILKVFLDLDS